MAIVVERVKMMEAPISSKKVEPVIEIIRGEEVTIALQKLQLINKKAAHYIRKLLASAIANVENNKKMKVEGMTVVNAWVTKGRKYKRYRPVSRGRAHPYTKHRANIFIEIGYGT